MTTLPDLEAMDRAGLARLRKDLIGGPVPASMSQPMQLHFLAFELQAKREGGLAAALSARLDRIAAGEERKPSPTLQPGAEELEANLMAVRDDLCQDTETLRDSEVRGIADWAWRAWRCR